MLALLSEDGVIVSFLDECLLRLEDAQAFTDAQSGSETIFNAIVGEIMAKYAGAWRALAEGKAENA